MKICSKCGLTKNFDDFYKRKSSKDGLRSECKDCKKKHDKQYNKDNKQTINEKKRASYHNNIEKEHERAKMFYKDNPDYFKEWRKNYYQEHKEETQAQRMKRRALEKEVTIGYVPSKPKSELYKRDKGICGICNNYVEYDNVHIDHIVPLSKGGEHSMSNLQLSHSWCNLKKGNKI